MNLASRARRGLSALPHVVSAAVVAVAILWPMQQPSAARIQGAASPLSFQLLDWETSTLASHFGRLAAGLAGNIAEQQGDAQIITKFLENKRPMDRPAAEAAIERAVARTYSQLGVVSQAPLLAGTVFPPILVSLTNPPHVLIVSPRAAIRVSQSVPLVSDLSDAAASELERSADSLGVSSLVVAVGGIATYPSMVLLQGSPEEVLANVAHEWLHQYLVFFPLGQQYFSSEETREINETTAEIVGREVGKQVAGELGLAVTAPATQPQRTPGTFDFAAYLRQTRQTVEQLLSSGRIADAEAYMRLRRADLEYQGHHLRKLNQAYFAFYGSYTEGPAAAPSNPIPGLLLQLRDQSKTVQSFLARVRAIVTVRELQGAVGR